MATPPTSPASPALLDPNLTLPQLIQALNALFPLRPEYLAQLFSQLVFLDRGSSIGTTEVELNHITVPARPWPVKVRWTAYILLNWPTGAPSWVCYANVRKDSMAGTVLNSQFDTKSAAAGINNTGHIVLGSEDTIPANTERTYYFTAYCDANNVNSVSGAAFLQTSLNQ